MCFNHRSAKFPAGYLMTVSTLIGPQRSTRAISHFLTNNLHRAERFNPSSVLPSVSRDNIASGWNSNFSRNFCAASGGADICHTTVARFLSPVSINQISFEVRIRHTEARKSVLHEGTALKWILALSANPKTTVAAYLANLMDRAARMIFPECPNTSVRPSVRD